MRVACAGVAFWIAGCRTFVAPTVASAPTTIVSFDVVPTDTRDLVGYADGDLAPDGVPDLVSRASFDGPAINAFLTVERGDAVVRQWDTVVGEQPMPAFAQNRAIRGASTPGLVVYVDGARTNAEDGTVTPFAAGPHQIELRASAEIDLRPGDGARLVLERPDHSSVSTRVVAIAVTTHP